MQRRGFYNWKKITIFIRTFCRLVGELEYGRTFAPVLLRFAIPILTTEHMDDVVSSFFFLLIEPDWLVRRIRTAFGSGYFCFVLSLTSSLSLLLFEPKRESFGEPKAPRNSSQSLTSAFAHCSRPRKHSPSSVDLVSFSSRSAPHQPLLRSIGMRT